MSVWWSLIAVYWVWFFIDCVNVARRSRFWISSALGGSRGTVAHRAVGVSPPFPLAWRATSDDPPIAFSPDGLCNVPVGSSGRPTPLPQEARAWKWEDILKIQEKNGRVFINGQDFCATTPLSSGEKIRALSNAVHEAEPEARTALMSKQISDWFIPLRIQREVAVLRGRTALLAWLGTANFFISAIVSGYLLGNFATRLGPEEEERWAALFPRLGLAFLAVHFATLIAAWSAHRRLRPKEKKERTQLIMNAALLPSQALRLRAQIATRYFSPAHPLAWLNVLGDSAQRLAFAQQTLSDLNWPLISPRMTDVVLVGAITSWMRGRVTLEVDRLLQSSGLPPEKLLAPPARDSDASCSYCPRCRSQFMDGHTFCPEGVRLRTLK